MSQPKKLGEQTMNGIDIDLNQRPASYFWPIGLDKHLLSTIKGAERRAALKSLLDAGRLEDVPGFLAQSSLSEGERKAIGQIHPMFMGGEYLPDLLPNEVIVARIEIASTTRDMTCVYARRTKRRIVYRVIDEYMGETLGDRRTRTSTRPLTLGALEEFFSGAWNLFKVLEINVNGRSKGLDEVQGFVRRIESAFYPQFEELYRRRIEDWFEGRNSR